MQSINPLKEEFLKSLNSDTLSRECELFMVKSLDTIDGQAQCERADDTGPTGAGEERRRRRRSDGAGGDVNHRQIARL